jgi:YegS/Rv2252/BmrU family lipid kinase
MSISQLPRQKFVIVNPNAGNGKGRKDWERICGLFGKENIKIEYCFTERKGHATEICSEAVANGFRDFIIVGGDGSLNEAVNGIMMQKVCPTADITVGLIPVGTGNDWGRMFGIPMVYEGSVGLIARNNTMLHDIGIVKYFEGSTEKVRFFINIAGLGFEALVVKKSNRQKDKGRSNAAIYFYNLLTSLFAYRNTPADIIIEGTKTRSTVFSLNVGNGKYCGGGMRQTPDALPDDGLLDVTVIKDMGRIEVIRNLKLLYDGTILSHPKVDGYRTKCIRVESESLLYAEADGESLGHTPAEFSIVPAAIKVICSTHPV